MALPPDALLDKQVAYEGDDGTRQAVEALVDGYTARHKQNLQTLDELASAHVALGKAMTDDLALHRSAWERLRDKIPLLRGVAPERPQHVVLTEKIELAQRRTQEIGNYLDRIGVEITAVQEDLTRLQQEAVVAARNEERAARHVLDLKAVLETIEVALGVVEIEPAAARELEARRDAYRHKIWEHGAKLRLHAGAGQRLAAVIRMNNTFLEILRTLHGNMQSLYDAGNEVLGELEGKLAALAGAAKASELRSDLQQAMDGLRASVDKAAGLAAEHAGRMTRELRGVDEAARQAAESRRRAEREQQEARINETIAMAEKELSTG